MTMRLQSWPEHMQVVQWLGHDGPPTDTDRYNYAEIIADGKTLFLKEAKHTETGGSFENDIAWMEFSSQLQMYYPSLHARGLRPVAYQPGRVLLTEFLDAPLLGAPNALQASSFAPHLSRYVDVLLAIDRLGVGYRTDLSPRGESVTYHQLDKAWDAWYRRLNDEFRNKYIVLIEAARRVIREAPPLDACMQHGDFVPWHIFDKDGEWVLFDAEHAHHEWPRFYDLAYSYTRIYTRADNSDLARRLLALFIERIASEEADFWRQFMPVLTTRAVGVLSDALYDLPEVDYEERAHELLEACLADDKDFLAKTG